MAWVWSLAQEFLHSVGTGKQTTILVTVKCSLNPSNDWMPHISNLLELNIKLFFFFIFIHLFCCYWAVCIFWRLSPCRLQRLQLFFHSVGCLFGIFFFSVLFRAAPAAYVGSQARGQIGCVAAGLCHSHSNTRSLIHWARPRIEPCVLMDTSRFVPVEPWGELLFFFLFCFIKKKKTMHRHKNPTDYIYVALFLNKSNRPDLNTK